MSPGCAPQQPRFVEGGVDIAEGCRAESERVIRELPLLELVPRRAGRSPCFQAPGHCADAGPERRQRRAHSRVDISGEEHSKRWHDHGGGLDRNTGCGHRVERCATPRSKRTLDPVRDRSLNAIGKVERKRSEARLVVCERHFGLRVHAVRLR